MSYEDDLDEVAWQEYERRRMERSNMDCGYTPDSTGAGENQGKEDRLSPDRVD